MKKALLAGVLFLLPVVSFAAFDVDLKYGSKGDDVLALQEFLTDQGCYKGPLTGNFYSLTLAGVKCFQKAQGIKPVSGYVGPITRGVLNSILTEQAPDSEGDVSTSTIQIKDNSVVPTPVVTPTPTPAPTPAPTQSSGGGAASAPAEQPRAPKFGSTPVAFIATSTADMKTVSFPWTSDISATAEWGFCTSNGTGCLDPQQTQTGTSGTFSVDRPRSRAEFYYIRLKANGQETLHTGQIPQ